MNVCALRCTPGHIPRYMGRTSDNNKRCHYVPVVCYAAFASNVFYIRFSVYDLYYIITAYILLYHSCSIPPVSCSQLIIPYVFFAWYHLLNIYLLLYAWAYGMIFNACLWFEFIDTRVFIYARHLILASPLAGEFWLPWILMSRSQSLELGDSPVCWPERCNSNLDL